MPSRRELILAWVTSLMNQPGLGATAYRSRQAAVAREEGSVVSVEPVVDQYSELNMATGDWRLTVDVTVIVRGDVPDQVADPIVTEIHKRMMSDTTLGGLAIDVTPQTTTWDLMSADKDAATISNLFDIMYRTSQQDISV